MSSDAKSDTISLSNSSKIADGTISVKLYDNLLAELRCPSCACPMKAPIKLCESGHATCQLCTKILAKCPLCVKPFTEVRSLTLEAMSAKAQFKCTNAALGCPVRLQVNLLSKHEEQCGYQLGDCFMGKVWDNCKWHGRGIDWIDHCELDHREKVFFGDEVTRTWELKRNPEKPICAFYIFRVFNETFNFYQIYDNLRNVMCWTMVCTSKNPHTAKQYSFEIELFSPSDETKISVQRNPCHSDRDPGLLRKSAMFGLGEIMSFMDKNRILHYRVKIVEVTQSKRMSISSQYSTETRNSFYAADFSLTNIEGSNVKKVPSEKIISRRSNKTDGRQNGMPKINTATSLPSSKNSSLKRSPIGELKRILSNGITDVFKSNTENGNRNIESSATIITSTAKPTIQTKPMMATFDESIIKTDSIDKTIIENNDLKKFFVRSYNIDEKNIEDFFNDGAMPLNDVNSVPKPPRMSLDMDKENIDEEQKLLTESGAIGAPLQSKLPVH